jgi:alanyl-tRNA synthetase
MANLNEIRSTFLNYFKKNDHQIVSSSPLVPRNDPTLMFVNSGMVQFKNLFTGLEKRDYVRAVTAQKCVRAGGKHNDLDNVGYTARHHTFFEMLGNFSFGDYFKSEAIPLAWNLITSEFGIPKDKLYVTIFHTDDEAALIWKKVGVPEDRIIRINTSDNFWQMGPTGPCGPCTEIFYDHGDHIWGGPPGSPDEDGDRFIEIWNIVFMQNERFEDGSMKALDIQSIDTGMGLERIGALLQGSHDNYDTDTMRSLMQASAEITSTDVVGNHNVHHRVIADHLRSTSFLIADGVLPANDGRGYVLRRIMRRAMRHAHLLGSQAPIMHNLVGALIQQMGSAYPELGQAQLLIEETLLQEETRFRQTLERGLKLLDDELDKVPEGEEFPGEAAFKLYDTYGFPLDLTQDALREKGRVVNTTAFDIAMADQKTKARAAWVGTGQITDEAIWFELAENLLATDFLGYETDKAEAQLLKLVKDGNKVSSAKVGNKVQLIFNQTPFYAESGGQVGDQGYIHSSNCMIQINDTKKFAGLIIHSGIVSKGSIEEGDSASLIVDSDRKNRIKANHSATHLLNEALRQLLGDHVAQRGSLNNEDRLRFDFSHSSLLTNEEIRSIEKSVNKYIRQNSSVQTRVMTPDDARGIGAQALFGEKYGDEVRVVSMGYQKDTGKGLGGETYSLELCGGTHVNKTGEIGAFTILSDSASSAGVRRIEALTGESAMVYLANKSQQVNDLSTFLKVSADQLNKRVNVLMDERRSLTNEVAELKRKLALSGEGTGEIVKAENINGISFFAQVYSGISGKDLPSLIDEHKDRLKSGIILLITESDNRVAVAVGVSSDLTGKISAVDIVRSAVSKLGGKGGGGRPDLAQGGGTDISGADAAITAVKSLLK